MNTRESVLAVLVREADLDGIAIITESEIAAEIGVGQTTVGRHIHALAKDGVLSIGLRAHATPNNAINTIQLAESVLA